MSRSAQVQVQGGRAFRKAMADAGIDIADLKQAHAEAAATVAAAARPAAPHRSGKLAGSIRSSGTKTAGVVRAGGAAVPYAQPIHWGWPRRHIKPHMFVTGPAAATEPTWGAVFERHIDRILDKIAATADGRGD
jgi:hypothetical protein